TGSFGADGNSRLATVVVVSRWSATSSMKRREPLRSFQARTLTSRLAPARRTVPSNWTFVHERSVNPQLVERRWTLPYVTARTRPWPRTFGRFVRTRAGTRERSLRFEVLAEFLRSFRTTVRVRLVLRRAERDPERETFDERSFWALP